MYGERCHESLKLESPNIQAEPFLLLRMLGQYARRLKKNEDASPITSQQKEMETRLNAEKIVKQSLKGHPLRQFIFNWVVRNARTRMRDRENIRFIQTQILGRFRNIFIQLGKRLEE